MFVGGPVDAMVGDVFSLGRLIFTNGVLTSGTEAWSVDLTATLMLTLPGMGDHMLSLPMTLLNTPNTPTDPDSTDFVIFPLSVPPQAFSANGMSFTLELVGFGMRSGGEIVIVPSLGVPERDSGMVELFGRVTTPEPATVLILSIGLVTLVARPRRRRDR